jgi:hypothetical protein
MGRPAIRHGRDDGRTGRGPQRGTGAAKNGLLVVALSFSGLSSLLMDGTFPAGETDTLIAET